MRILRPCLAVCLALPFFAGCQSTGGGLASTGIKWPWAKKSGATETSVADNSGTKYPQPPSQTASPEAALAGTGYGPTAPNPQSGYSPYSPGAPSGYAAAPTSYNAYPSTPPGEYGGTGLYDPQGAASYQSYGGTTPTAAPQTGYGQPGQPGGNVALDSQYMNPAYAQPSTQAPTGAPQANAYAGAGAMPNYGGTATAAMPNYMPPATSAPGYDYGSTAATQPLGSPGMSQQPTAQTAAMPAANPYTTPDATAANPAYTADNRAVNPAASMPGGYPANGAADYSAAAAGAPGAGAWSAQPGGAPAAAGALPATPTTGYGTADTSGYQPGQTGYQPGQTGYAPGNTGYQPTGTAPYQSPAGAYQSPQGRTDTPYRPGGTSTYPRQGASTTQPANDLAGSGSGLSVVSPASYEGTTPETAPVNPIPTTAPATEAVGAP